MAAKLSNGQIAGIIIGAVLLVFFAVAIGVSFLPFRLTQGDILSLYQLMKDVDAILLRAGVSYIVEGGTLLGCVRHGGMIPWDDDLDIQILAEDEQAFLALRPVFATIGLDIRPTGFGWRIQPAGKRNLAFPFCDVFITSFGPDACSHNKNHSFKRCYFKREEYFPVKRYKFGEIEVNGPSSPNAFLDRCYGATWPDTWFKTFNHKFLYFHIPQPKKMKPKDYKCAVPTGPVVERNWDVLGK